MAKLNFESIEGYKPEMTAEEKLKLLDSYEIPDPDYSGYIQKSAFDKTASELAEAKRQLKAKMTADEQAEAERATAQAELQQELETLRKERTVSNYKASYLALGYDEALASATAEALADGKTDVVFANQKVFIEAQQKVLNKEVLKGTPRPPAGEPSGGGGLEAQIKAAQESGNAAQLAALIRQQAEEKK